MRCLCSQMTFVCLRSSEMGGGEATTMGDVVRSPPANEWLKQGCLSFARPSKKQKEGFRSRCGIAHEPGNCTTLSVIGFAALGCLRKFVGTDSIVCECLYRRSSLSHALSRKLCLLESYGDVQQTGAIATVVRTNVI